MKSRLLDLFCGAGGAGMGYARAGFEVVGVDIKPQPRYPFTFIQADAMTFDLSGFDAIHASPPCQQHSATRRMHRNEYEYPDLVAGTRDKLVASGVPYVIENVVGAPLKATVLLCGQMFGLRIFRHRLFEASFFMFQPGHTHGKWRTPKSRNGFGSNRLPGDGEVYMPVGNFANLTLGAAAMGVDWMRTKHEVAESVPPAYTEYIGKHLMAAVCEAQP